MTKLQAMPIPQSLIYQEAKSIFLSLGVKEDITLDIDIDHVKLFRKYLCEMAKRQDTNNKYATRHNGDKLFVSRLQ